MTKPIHSLIFFLLLFSANSDAEYFTAPMLKANWKTEISKTSCQLKQEIPLYGSAEFIHRSGDTLQFSIQEQRHKSQIIKASLSTMPSPWQQSLASPHDHLVYLDHASKKNYGQLAVYGDTAETMIDALLQGQTPTFTYIRAASDLDLVETRVAVSAIKFLESYEAFTDCRKHMLPFGLRDLQNTVMFFDPASVGLNHPSQQEISKLASYLKEINASKIIIGSETAMMGRADKKWFTRRSKAINLALMAEGISKDRITFQAKFKGSQDKNTIRVHVFGPDAVKWFFYRKGNIQLTRTEKKRLNLLAKYLQTYYQQGKLVINSHTDSMGSRASNKRTSRKRGNVIKRYLESQGVSPKQILVKAFGESKPRKSNRTPKGRNQNRRVEFSFSS